MNLSQNIWCLVLLVVLATLVVTEARRKNDKAACKYNKKGVESECDTATNTKTITYRLKKGDPKTCTATMDKVKPCNATANGKKSKVNKDCKYDRQNASWSECDEATGKKKKTMTLREGSSPNCEPTQTKMKNCVSKKKAKTSKKACVYEKKPWSACDAETNKKQREMILTSGNSTQCLSKKTVSKDCKKTCRYDRGPWSPCDKTTRQKQRQLTPKSNSLPQCTPTVESRPCYVRAELTAPKANKCRYKIGPWSECDPRSNTMIMSMTLKSGDPALCQKSKTLSKKCKIACKFRKGEWSECDETTQLMARVDSLVSGSPSQCYESRQITKKCKRKCKYTYGQWGECDPVTNHRTRVKKLVEGDATKCLAEDIVTRPCGKKNGKERCFFGSWGEFGPCTNGVITKNRQVLQGGVECERKAVITQACTKPTSR